MQIRSIPLIKQLSVSSPSLRCDVRCSGAVGRSEIALAADPNVNGRKRRVYPVGRWPLFHHILKAGSAAAAAPNTAQPLRPASRRHRLRGGRTRPEI